jgi:hypothetical protein
VRPDFTCLSSAEPGPAPGLRRHSATSLVTLGTVFKQPALADFDEVQAQTDAQGLGKVALPVM